MICAATSVILHPPEIVRSCRAELEKVANLTLYTTPIAMDDLEEVRAAMGYDRINLYGGSYGTNAALVYLRRHPARVRSIVLKGVAPPDFKLPLSFNKGVQHAMDRLIEDCGRDAECGKAFPKFKEEFAAVLAKLEKAPANFIVVNPVTGIKQQIELSRAAFVDSLRLMLYVPDMISMLPLIIHSAYENDYIPFATYAFLLTRQIDPQLARGMQLSVLCAEHVPFITDADIKRETTGTYYGDDRVKAYRRTCAEWPECENSGYVPPAGQVRRAGLDGKRRCRPGYAAVIRRSRGSNFAEQPPGCHALWNTPDKLGMY